MKSLYAAMPMANFEIEEPEQKSQLIFSSFLFAFTMLVMNYSFKKITTAALTQTQICTYCQAKLPNATMPTFLYLLRFGYNYPKLK